MSDLLTPEQYRTYAHPYHQKIFSELKGRVPGILFAKEQTDIELMVESGAEVLSIGRCLNFADCKQRYGHKVALPVAPASHVLSESFPEASSALMPITSSPLTVVHLGFREADVGHSLRGFGFLVPRNERAMPLMGALFSDSVFPHHAPKGHRLIRVFLGGAQHPEVKHLTDEQVRTRAVDGLRNLLQITGDPVMVNMIRFDAAMPQYHAGHRDHIARFREVIDACPGLYAVGNYLEGASLNDCVRVANLCADSIICDTSCGNMTIQESHSENLTLC